LTHIVERAASKGVKLLLLHDSHWHTPSDPHHRHRHQRQQQQLHPHGEVLIRRLAHRHNRTTTHASHSPTTAASGAAAGAAAAGSTAAGAVVFRPYRPQQPGEWGRLAEELARAEAAGAVLGSLLLVDDVSGLPATSSFSSSSFPPPRVSPSTTVANHHHHNINHINNGGELQSSLDLLLAAVQRGTAEVMFLSYSSTAVHSTLETMRRMGLLSALPDTLKSGESGQLKHQEGE
ncbi:hypothetical protein Agub_g14760, partial [Astrephomene gubernaculifera]